MLAELTSGRTLPVTPPLKAYARAPWRRWQSLRRDMLRHIHECDRLGVPLSIDKLAEDLDEAVGLVERRVEELQSLRFIHCLCDRRIELEGGPDRKCG